MTTLKCSMTAGCENPIASYYTWKKPELASRFLKPICAKCADRMAAKITVSSQPSHVGYVEIAKIDENIENIENFIAKRTKVKKSWEDWFRLGGQEDVGSPVSGREIIGYAKADVAKAEKDIEKFEAIRLKLG